MSADKNENVSAVERDRLRNAREAAIRMAIQAAPHLTEAQSLVSLAEKIYAYIEGVKTSE